MRNKVKKTIKDLLILNNNQKCIQNSIENLQQLKVEILNSF